MTATVAGNMLGRLVSYGGETDAAGTVAAFLEELNRLDPGWVAEMIGHRPPCNRAIADHPTVQAGDAGDGAGPRAGLLGLLNGWLLAVGSERVVVADVEGDGLSVQPVTGFKTGRIDASGRVVAVEPAPAGRVGT